jgi:hypothetical protein
MAILNVLDERTFGFSFAVVERADGIIMSGAEMAEPFVFADESLRELAAPGKWTLELKIFLPVMDCSYMSFEIVVTSEGDPVGAARLWTK